MSRKVIITGTGTGVGKTYFTCQLSRFARQGGVEVRAVKPVESGCDGSFVEDGELLARATGQSSPPRALVRLKNALAPCLAADMEEVKLDPQEWIESIEATASSASLTMIETAGGLLSPLAWNFDTCDLARTLKTPCIVVAANRLGCIHDVRAVLEVLRSRSIEVVAVVLNSCDADQSSAHNLATLNRLEPSVQVLAVDFDGQARSVCGEILRLIGIPS